MGRRSGTEFDFVKAFNLIGRLDKYKEVAVKEAIEKSSKYVQEDLDKFFKKDNGHFRSGRTYESLIKNPKLTVTNGRYEMKMGFDAKKGGYVANFFEKGTPRIQPTRFISKAFKNKMAIETMNQVLSKYLKESDKE